jgi:MoxR-like ATPase
MAVPCRGYNSRGEPCGQQVDLQAHPDGFCGLCKGSWDHQAAGTDRGDLMQLALPPEDDNGQLDPAVWAQAYAQAGNDQQRLVIAAMESDIPAIVWGLPGIGKTAFISQVAQVMDAEFQVVIASQYEPADIAGQPYVVGGETNPRLEHLPSPWARRLMEASGQGRPAILFLDELDKAPVASQNAALRLINEREIGGHPLGDNVRVLAAANPPELGGWDLSAPMANRLMHIDFTPDHELVVQGLASGWSPIGSRGRGSTESPQQFAQRLQTANHQWRSVVATYLQRNPASMHDMPKDASRQGRAWPSPRSWENAIRVLSVLEARGLAGRRGESAVARQAVVGLVGAEHANSFFSFVRNVDLPDPEAVLRDPANFQVPREPDQLLVSVNAVVNAVLQRPSTQRVDAFWQVLDRVQQAGRTEWAFPALSRIAKFVRSPEAADLGIDVPETFGSGQSLVDLLNGVLQKARVKS